MVTLVFVASLDAAETPESEFTKEMIRCSNSNTRDVLTRMLSPSRRSFPDYQFEVTFVYTVL